MRLNNKVGCVAKKYPFPARFTSVSRHRTEYPSSKLTWMQMRMLTSTDHVSSPRPNLGARDCEGTRMGTENENRETKVRLGSDILALVCPDWRPATLVYDASEGVVAYSNWHCLDLLESEDPARLVSGRLAFRTPDLDRRFRDAVREALSGKAETVVMIGRCADEQRWVSVNILNPQGFFRDVLARCLGLADSARNLLIVEFRITPMVLEDSGTAALRDALDLTPAEAALAMTLARGGSLDQITRRSANSHAAVSEVMQRLLEKAGCTTYSEFMRLVFALCPTRPDGDGTARGRQWTT